MTHTAHMATRSRLGPAVCVALLTVAFLGRPPLVAAPREPAAAARPPSGSQLHLDAAFAQAMQELSKDHHSDHGGDLENDAAMRALTSAWTQAGSWAADYLDTHPESSAHEMARALQRMVVARSPAGADEVSLRAEALKLQPSTYVLCLTYLAGDVETASDILVVGRKKGAPFRVAWNLLDLAKTHFESKDAIGHWALLTQASYYSGPMLGRLRPLPSDETGRPRFLVVAGQNANGGTQMGQLGFWAWDGDQAQPLLVKDYWQEADHDRMRFKGNRIQIRTKEELNNLWSPGSRTGALAEWVLDVTPQGVVDHGRRLLLPEFRALDRLFGMILHRQPSTKLAAPAVEATLQALVPPGKPEGLADAPGLGLLVEGRRFQRSGRRFFEVTFDTGVLTFTVEARHGVTFFSALVCSAAQPTPAGGT